MLDFEEISHSGGKLKIKFTGTRYQISFSHSNPHACANYFIGMNMDNHTMRFLPAMEIFYGEESKEHMLVIPMISDQEGFFGRRCSECNEYFRMKDVGEYIYCPYCSFYGHNIAFITENQKQYIERYFNTFLDAITKGKNVEIDFDSLIDKLSNNKSGFVYSEERQQTTLECSSCHTTYDILGEFGCCPNCGKRNSLYILEKKLNFLEERVLNPRYDHNQREQREREWEEILKSTISEFEAFCNDLSGEILKIPMTPQRRRQIKELSFQNILKAAQELNNYLAVNILIGISEEQKTFLNKEFNKRHLLTHKSGIVDQEYLDNTQDNSVRLREKIRIRSSEVKSLINLIRILSRNYYDGYESIK